MNELARGYARALFQIAGAEGVLERVEDELFRFARTLEIEGKLREALTDISLPPEHRAKMVEDLLGGKAAPHTVNIITFIVQQGRARDLPKIIDSLVELAAEEREKAVAEVRTAVPLDDENRRKLIDAINRATGKRVDLKVIIDPNVIGGLLVRVGDQVFDGTVKRRLQLARESIGRVEHG